MDEDGSGVVSQVRRALYSPFFIFVCLQHEFIDFLSDASQEEGGDLEHFHHIMQVEQTVLRLKIDYRRMTKSVVE